MLKQITVATSVVLTTLTINLLPIHAQPHPSQRDLVTIRRAQNLARQAAEKVNGGLQRYRAENSMYGPAESSRYTYDGHGTWSFDFTGHRPDSDTPTVESVVTVSRTGIVNVDYNGPIRSTP